LAHTEPGQWRATPELRAQAQAALDAGRLPWEQLKTAGARMVGGIAKTPAEVASAVAEALARFPDTVAAASTLEGAALAHCCLKGEVDDQALAIQRNVIVLLERVDEEGKQEDIWCAAWSSAL
jgi:hypothetical protein